MSAKRRKTSGGLLSESLKAHANDETSYGTEYIDLPGGITGGIAKLVDAKLGEFKKGPNQGKQFLYLGGLVVEPETAIQLNKVLQVGKFKGM